VKEGNAQPSNATFTISIDKPLAANLVVPYQTVNGSAVASDFTAKSANATITAGTTSVIVNIVVAGDTAVETDETFTVVLGAATGVVTIDPVGDGTILGDDLP
jgi:hypothetical protein